MVNELYSCPLHGVCCRPYAAPSQGEPYQLSLVFEPHNPLSDPKLIWHLFDEGARYHTDLRLFRQADELQLHVDCEGHGIFTLKDDAIAIDWSSQGTDSAHYFQTLVMALWLELRGVLCLHANAVAIGDRVIGLMAPSGTGKSTLTAALCQQGAKVMTDDMVALHPQPGDSGEAGYLIYPSWPLMRIWPKTLENLSVGDAAEQVVNQGMASAEKVHQRFDKRLLRLDTDAAIGYSKTPAPLKAFYLLNRVDQQDAGCTIKPIAPHQAVIYLLQNSMLGDAYRGLGIEAERLAAISKLLTEVPFFQVTYAGGAENLQQVVGCLLGWAGNNGS